MLHTIKPLILLGFYRFLCKIQSPLISNLNVIRGPFSHRVKFFRFTFAPIQTYGNIFRLCILTNNDYLYFRTKKDPRKIHFHGIDLYSFCIVRILIGIRLCLILTPERSRILRRNCHYIVCNEAFETF